MLFLALTAAPRTAVAGAFMLDPGTGQFIAGVGYTEATRRFDPWGHAVPTPSFSKVEASGYLEYGVTGSFDLVLAPTLAHSSDGPATNSVTGSDTSAFGGRLALFRAPSTIIAVQALVQPATANQSGAEMIADGGARSFASDLRLMIGRSFSIFGLPSFVDIDPGARLRAGPLPTEMRVDATLGVRVRPTLLVLLQDFSSFAPPAGPLVPRTDYSKLQASLVYDISRTWSVQIGGLRTFSGRNIVRETGPLVAAWYRF
jgi:protein XagA